MDLPSSWPSLSSMIPAFLAWFVASLVASPTAATQPTGSELAIVVNRANPIDNLSLAELRQIVRLERQSWPSNRRVTVVLRERGNGERLSVLREICGMSEAEFERHLLHATYRGDVATPPRTIGSAAGMRRFVFNVPGAVGFLISSDTDSTVKILRIDGKLPGDPGYLLADRGAGRPPQSPR